MVEGREPTGVLAKQRDQRLLEVAGRNAFEAEHRVYHGPAYLLFRRLVTNSRVFEHPESTIDAYARANGAGRRAAQ
jgi:hypothetical protein